MKTIIFMGLLIFAPLTCYAATNQSECPPDTIWRPSTNQCYPDPNAPSVIKARQEEEKARLEAERLKEEQRAKDWVADPNRKDNVPKDVIVNPSY